MEVKKSVTTGMNVEKCQLTWTINNFDTIRKSDDYIRAQHFTFKAGETIGLETDWKCYLQPSKDKEEISWIGCYVKLERKPKINVNGISASVKVKIERLDQKGTFVNRRTEILQFMKDGQPTLAWGFPSIIRKDAELKDLPLIEGCLILELELQLIAPESFLKPNPQAQCSFATSEKMYQLKFSKKLQQDLGKLLVTPTPNSDATTKIVTSDEKEFAVSRGIISARSPVFQRMFESDMKESKTGVIRITDISSKTMTVLLRFIYTGTLHADWRAPDVITELVYASEKYQLHDLLEFLNDVIGFVCTKENVGKLISLARKLQMKKAECDLLEFMKNNISSFDDILSFAEPNKHGCSSDSSESSDQEDGE